VTTSRSFLAASLESITAGPAMSAAGTFLRMYRLYVGHERTVDEAMISRRVQSDTPQPATGWAFASLLALLGVALASEYLFPSSKDRPAEWTPSPRDAERAIETDRHGRH